MATAALLEAESEILFKANGGQINIDKAEGVVECFVAAIGNKDSVGDIILPGAFSNSLKRRKPRVVWGHNWNEPIGKVLSIEEVAPKDRRLPKKMYEAGVGGLLAKVQFNLNSERGREAFSTVAFFGEEQEWCADTETEILTDRGWLKYDEVTVEDQAYVLDPELGWGRFETIEAVNVWPAKERSMRLIETGGHSSLTTAAHRWPLASNTNGGNVRWATTETLQAKDRMVRSAPRSDAPAIQKYADAFVELVAWFWTEGWVPPADHPDAGLYVAQSTRVNPQHVASIRCALQEEFAGQWSERHSTDDMARFRLKREAAETILAVTGVDKEPTPEFLMNLTRAQLSLLIETCMNGDGHRSASGQATWYQVSERGVRAFEMACALSGQATNTKAQKDYGNRYGSPPTRVALLRSGVAKPLDAIRVKNLKPEEADVRTPATDEWVTTTGEIWCPTTTSGTWLARRNGAVYFTGNSIGYKTINADYDPNAQANMLKEVELYEVSPVLHGANQLTGTLSVKDGETGACGMNGCECGTKTMSVEPGEEKACGVPQHGLLPRALSVVMKQPIQIRQINGDMVVFDTPPDRTWVTKFAFDDDRFMFVEPKQVEVTMVLRPLAGDGHEMPVGKAGDCGCGCGGSGGCKNAPMIEMETKAGRKISNRNLQKIEQALNLLKDVVAAASQPVVGGELEQKLPKTDSKRLQIGSDRYHDHRGMINVSVKSEEEAAVVVDSLAETDASFTFPSSVGYFEGDSSVSILVPAAEAVANVIKEQVVGALSGLDFDVSVAVEK